MVDAVTKLVTTTLFKSLARPPQQLASRKAAGRRADRAASRQVTGGQRGAALVVQMAWSPDSRLLLTAMNNGDIVVWDAAEKTFGASTGRKRTAAARRGATSAGNTEKKRSGRRVTYKADAEAGGDTEAKQAPPPSKPDAVDEAYEAPWKDEEQFVATLVDMLATSPGERKVAAMKFSPDGKTLLVQTVSRVLKLWDFSGAVRAFQSEYAWWQESIACSSIVISAIDGSIDDLKVGHFTRQCLGHMDKIVASAFSPCGRSVVSGSCDGTMRVWDATKAYQNAKASPHSGKTVSFVQWALTGNRIASFGKDNVVVLTDPATLTQIASWVMHSPVTSIAVNALCDRVAVGDAHGKVRLFRLERPTGHTDPYPVGTMTKLFSAEKCVHYLQPLCGAFSPSDVVRLHVEPRHTWDIKFSLLCCYCGNRTVVKKRIEDMVVAAQEQIAMLGPQDRYFQVRVKQLFPICIRLAAHTRLVRMHVWCTNAPNVRSRRV